MKKVLVLLAFILATALLFCGCDSGSAAGTNNATGGKSVAISEEQLFRLDAVNYDVGDIDGVKKLAESGVIYAYCSSAEGVNSTIDSLSSIPGAELNKYSTDNKNVVLTLVTLGEGTKASYSIEKVEMGDKAAISVYVKTNDGTADERKISEYHFARLDVPVYSSITVYLDGVQVGK